MVVRYMGTKRHMVESVRHALSPFATGGRAVDLFSGMGSVAETLSGPGIPVITNDALEFTACISRSRFLGEPRGCSAGQIVQDISLDFAYAKEFLSDTFADCLSGEQTALKGNRSHLARFMNGTRHVASSSSARRDAQVAKEAADLEHYKMTTLYFAAGYLSYRQAVETDALRYAIDRHADPLLRDWLLAAWISAVSVLINAPGHTAQFLQPNTDAACARIVRTWQRSVWQEFERSLERTAQVGSPEWRQKNQVLVTDALDLVSSGRLVDVDVVYADPPYTKDQYSRYYHVYETLYRYDYPDSNGAGRARSDRFSTGFSLKSSVKASFHDLCRHVSRLGLPLVVSYPTGGLLEQTDCTFDAIAGQYFSEVRTSTVDAKHSTMGASNGASKKEATENIYVCTGKRRNRANSNQK